MLTGQPGLMAANSHGHLAIATVTVGMAVPPQADPPGGESQSGGDLMLPRQVSVQDVESARAAIVLVIAGVMFFWRFMLRVAFAIIVVAAGLGLLVLLQNIHR